MTVQPFENTPYTAALLLADGRVFYGFGCGAPGTTYGELCFNTSMTGYQEIMTDPSYAGQIITFTFPHIGNVGANQEDIEAKQAGARGIVLREAISAPSNYRAEQFFNDWLIQHQVTGISGVDTRAITHLLRSKGPQNAAVIYPAPGEMANMDQIKETLSMLPSLEGMELAQSVTTDNGYSWKQTRWSHAEGYQEKKNGAHSVVAIDFGEKLNILRCLTSHDCSVHVVPATASVDEILAKKPDGVFLSNGPGDPAATYEYAGPMIKALIKAGIPIFGICLGHQLLALSLGAETEKMYQGHRGANHPVKRLEDNVVEITSQNHGFVVSHSNFPDELNVTHVSLFDGTIEGFRHKTLPLFGVQYHPESSPGPHDSMYLFERFVKLMKEKEPANA